MHVLMITSEYPTTERPYTAPFVKQEAMSLKQAGIDVDVFHYRGNKDWRRYVSLYPEVRRMLLRTQYDLIHAQFGQSGLFALPKRIPLVVTFRGSDARGIVDNVTGKYTLKGRILQFISRQVARIADETIAVSEHLLKYLPKRHYEIIPSGIDLERFKPFPREEARLRMGLPLDTQIILFGANPDVLRKRYSLAEMAVTTLNQRLPNVKLLVTKGIPFENMPFYINSANVLILTSAHEGSPNIVKEALACNTPVVSVNVGDVQERLENVDGCFVCEDDRPETISRYLERALSFDKLSNGRQAVAQLNIELTAQRIIRVYQRAISNNS